MPAIVPPAPKVYSFTQLEQLWIAAGGPGAVAAIAAAIAEAESGGRANALNTTDNNGTQTSVGLWQVSNGTHQYPAAWATPQGNAQEAVAKYKSAGNKWTPWGTFTSGAYKKYLPAGSSSAGDHGGAAIVAEVQKFLGVPYVWGGESPKGFDCSGLVQYALQQLGFKNVPRTSEEQWKWVQHITKAQLQPGDLVFYQGSEAGASAANPGHVAIYAGNNQIIQAPQTGMDVQQIPMPAGATGYGRIPGVGQAVVTPAASSNPNNGPTDDGGASWLSAIWDGIKGGWDFSAGIPGDVAGAANAAVSTADSIKGLTAPFVTIAHAVDWFINPGHWVRIGCLFFGSALTLMGIVTMTRTGRSYSISNPLAGASYEGASLPSTLPAPGGQLAPAVGIAEVTVGAILLFVAFHNLPTSVDSFGGFVGHLTSELQSGGTSG